MQLVEQLITIGPGEFMSTASAASAALILHPNSPLHD